jgi:hypothetical protein
MKAYKAGLRLVRKWLEIESGIVGKSTGPALAWTVTFLLSLVNHTTIKLLSQLAAIWR